MTRVTVQEAKAQLSRLLGLVEAGEEVEISRHGKPVARLVRAGRPGQNRRPGTWRDEIEVADDFDAEIDDSWMEQLDP